GAMHGLMRALLATAGRFEKEILSDLLGQAWAQILQLAEDAQSLQSTAGRFLNHLSALPSGLEGVLKLTLARVVSDLEQRWGTLDVGTFLSELAFILGLYGHTALARDAAQRIADDERRDRAVAHIDGFAYFHALPDPSAVERTLFQSTTQIEIAV